MLQSPAHIIATMRARTDYVLETNKKGKQEPRKVGMAPVQREGMDYEFSVVFDLDSSHTAHASKDRTSLFDGEYFIPSAETGKKLLAWLNTGADAPKPERRPTVSEWLDALSAQFTAAQDADAVDAIIARPDVQRAQNVLHNGARTRLQQMIDAAVKAAAKLETTDELPDEIARWPGVAPVETEAA